MSIDGGQFTDNTCCEPGLLALRAAGKIAQDETAVCDKCLFPFCVMHEARKVNRISRAYLIAGMAELGIAKAAIASKLGIKTRTVYRSIVPVSKCHWCNVDNSPSNVFCRTSTSTVAFDKNDVVVVLSSHRHATKHEYGLASNLIENMFPYGVLHSGNGDVHGHWEVTNVSKDEAQEVYGNMKFLGQFTHKLGR